MKAKTFFFALFAIFLSAGFTSVREAHAQLGFAAGLNYDNFGDVNYEDGSKGVFESANGYHVGIFYDLAAGPLAIRPGVFYRQINSAQVEQAQVGDVVGVSQTFDLSMVEIPVDLRLRLPLPLIAPYALAGPVFSFPNSSSDDSDFDDNFKNLYVSASVGAGVEVSVPVVGIKAFPEIRYAFGLSGLMEDDVTIGGTTFTAEDSQRLNSIMLRVGVVF